VAKPPGRIEPNFWKKISAT